MLTLVLRTTNTKSKPAILLWSNCQLGAGIEEKLSTCLYPKSHVEVSTTVLDVLITQSVPAHHPTSVLTSMNPH